MKCLFCGNECSGKWHIDCFDDQIINEFGIDIYCLLLERSAYRKETFIPPWLNRLIEGGVRDGKRHSARLKIFYFLKIFGADNKTIIEKLWKFNDNCHPPENEERMKYHVRYLIRRGEEIKKADGSN